MDDCSIRMRNVIPCAVISVAMIFCLFCCASIFVKATYGQSIENWQTYTDPAKRFILFYPPDLELKGRENFLSSVDVTLGNQNFNREFKITVTYNDDDKSHNKLCARFRDIAR